MQNQLYNLEVKKILCFFVEEETEVAKRKILEQNEVTNVVNENTWQKEKIMTLVLSIQLFFAICLKVFPSEKPNYLYGYQWGGSKKSLEHWKITNKYASSYLIILCSLTIILSLISENQKFDGRIAVLTIYISGLILTYFVVEKRLKKIESATSANCG